MTTFEQFASAIGVILLVMALRLAGKATFNHSIWRRNAPSQLQILEQVRLNAQSGIHVIRFGDKVYVIAAHSSGHTLLDTRGWPLKKDIEKGAAV